jgi:hypothetical protein
MKKLLGIVLAVAALSLALSGCKFMYGNDGTVYGEYDHPYYASYLSLGGFPSGTLYTNTYYAITTNTSDTTYDVWYRLYDDSNNYYPSSTQYWHSYYTISANSGGPYLQSGADKFFDLYLGTSGMFISGSARDVAARLGTTSYSKDGLKINITNEVVQLTDEQKAKLQANTAATK